jgi:hypothetical protein
LYRSGVTEILTPLALTFNAMSIARRAGVALRPPKKGQMADAGHGAPPVLKSSCRAQPTADFVNFGSLRLRMLLLPHAATSLEI